MLSAKGAVFAYSTLRVYRRDITLANNDYRKRLEEAEADYARFIREQASRLEDVGDGESRLQLALLKRMYPEIKWGWGSSK